MYIVYTSLKAKIDTYKSYRHLLVKSWNIVMDQAMLFFLFCALRA